MLRLRGTTVADLRITDGARELLATRVESFEKLELLSLACSERTVWTVRAAAARLRLGEPQIDVALQELEAAGLLGRDATGYRYAPARPELDDAAAELCRLYAEDRLLIVNILTTSALDRIRSSAATTFADAFRFRKPDKGDS